MQNMTDLNTGEDKKRIGVYGGAFNPVHNGHIRLALGYIEDLRLDKLIIIPTAVPPHKTAEGLVSGSDRINMLSLAAKDIPQIEISDIEFKRQGKSYTYLTLLDIRKLYPDADLFLIIGADQFLTFTTWYHYKDILSLVTLCTQARQDEAERLEMLDYAVNNDELKGKYILSDREIYKVSSSEIRRKIRDGEDVSSLLPDGVYEYIKEKGLYIV